LLEAVVEVAAVAVELVEEVLVVTELLVTVQVRLEVLRSVV
jgi:hypothetical protein